MPKVAIIGAGKMGNVIEFCLRGSAETVMWDKDPSRSPSSATAAEAALDSDVVFFCLPSWALREAATAVRPFTGPRTVIVCVSKGLEHGTGADPAAVIRSVFSARQPFVFLGGPMLAPEIMNKKGGAAVVASRYQDSHDLLDALFFRAPLRVEHTADVAGVVMAGVLKNVYAMAMGMTDGSDWGNNRKGWLTAMAIGEMGRLLPIFGGRRDTAFGTAGVGDLLATGSSEHSHHRKIGSDLATGRTTLKCEGIYSTPVIIRTVGRRLSQFPLLAAVGAVVGNKEKAKKALERLFDINH